MTKYKPFFCPSEELPRSFKKVGEELAVVGAMYQCENKSCGFMGREYELYGHDLDSDGFIKAIRDNIRRIRYGR